MFVGGVAQRVPIVCRKTRLAIVFWLFVLTLNTKVCREMKKRAMTLDTFVETMTVVDPEWTVSGLGVK